ncbi:tetratricopeptide repeat protein [Chryseobacterium arthrosphaerae]|uniref:tetratricopeptide repeat protein n=1 Tax=Chryseobacterium arthrosphaerae TaxID=651561 RepID=UPI001BAEDD52|nr:tetratricopeptide repeat protein [Chryseobacterium arthrosphaerae]QUY57979.1 tetratricopeptide repeat protein [Chryseobacterium arthrosphaerae]
MRKYFFSLLFGFLFSIPALSCLNGEKMILANMEILYVDHSGEVPRGHGFGSDDQLEEFLVKLEKGYHDTKDLDYLSDKGFILIILGRYQEAIELYKKIEAIQPGRYSTASNIGTAYELTGNNAEALKWIEKAVTIDPASHSGSEWIHINILKAKIKGSQPISSKDLIGKDFGDGRYPVSDLNKDELQLLKMQLYYQLNERVSFVKPKDKIVAQLLFDLGNAAFLMNQNDNALSDYKLAKEYGFENPLINDRMKAVLSKTGKSEAQESRFDLMETVIAIAAFLLAGFIVFIFRKKILLLLK